MQLRNEVAHEKSAKEALKTKKVSLGVVPWPRAFRLLPVRPVPPLPFHATSGIPPATQSSLAASVKELNSKVRSEQQTVEQLQAELQIQKVRGQTPSALHPLPCASLS